METIHLAIDGMGCGACVKKVNAALTAVPGVKVETVGVGSASLQRDPKQASDEVLTRALAAAGYSARKEA